MRHSIPGMKSASKKKLEPTTKMKLLFTSALGLWLMTLFVFWSMNGVIGVLAILVAGWWWPAPWLITAVAIGMPIDAIFRIKTRSAITTLLTQHKKLKVVGITGSFGKTSAKNFLGTLLNTQMFTMTTPHSYNTYSGIYRTLEKELTEKHEVFVAELGAYGPGDIKKLANTTIPTYGLITQIGLQHAERYRSWSSIVSTKLELYDYVGPENTLINLDSKLLTDYLSHHSLPLLPLTYSLTNPEATYFVSTYSLKREGMTFTLNYRNKPYEFQTHLFGTSHLENLVGAIGMAHHMGMNFESIKRAITFIRPYPHRLHLIPTQKGTIIDNSYSSNPTGFTRIMNDFKRLDGTKAVITPGLVELGRWGNDIHFELGKAAVESCQEIILVGRNTRTENIKKGLLDVGFDGTISFTDANRNEWDLAMEKAAHYDWVLIENDIPQNYF